MTGSFDSVGYLTDEMILHIYHFIDKKPRGLTSIYRFNSIRID
ncbi:MAG: hypothetical protein [Olavius algarvensis Delta 4 endosymbiont]|nr:MAG: hypothetical protein [Olavius algarvensis Delta 4 endosymbiont]